MTGAPRELRHRAARLGEVVARNLRAYREPFDDAVARAHRFVALGKGVDVRVARVEIRMYDKARERMALSSCAITAAAPSA